MPKLAIVYLSTQGNTMLMAEGIAEGAISRNIDVEVRSFYEWNPMDAASADGIAVGSSTFNYAMHPPIQKFLDQMLETEVKGK